MSEETKKPTYYSITPADVRYDKNLTMGTRMMYGEISALSNKEGYCWASNKYFADLYDVTIQTITRWIKQLEDNGYVIIEYRYGYSDKNKHPIKMRMIKIPSENSAENRLECINKNNDECINKNVKTNNNTRLLNNDKSLSNISKEILSNALSYSTSKESAVYDDKDNGLFSEQKTTKKTSKDYLTNKQKTYLPLIKKVVSNKNIYFNHRLPNKENDYKTTVLIKKSIDYLEKINQGTFLKNILLNDTQKKYNLSMLEKPMLFNELEDVILYAIDEWEKYFIIGNEPKNKENIKSLSLDKWFYNEHNQFSYFLECLLKKAKTSRRQNYEKIRDAIPEEFLKWFDKLYQYKFHEFTEEDFYIYYLGVQQIYGRHKQLKYLYDDVVTISGWKHYLSPPSTFAYNFYMYLRDYPYWTNVKILGTDGQLWKDWRKYALGMWKVDVNPSEKFINEQIAESEYRQKKWEQYQRNMELERIAHEERMLKEHPLEI